MGETPDRHQEDPGSMNPDTAKQDETRTASETEAGSAGHGHADSPPLIVSLNSRKGGVGKTTIGLAIAREALDETCGTEAGERRPVVFLDTDILGTEVADYLPPSRRRARGARARGAGNEPWDLGILELLTQSTGGNTDFETWVWEWLRRHEPGGGTRSDGAGMPRLEMGARGGADAPACPLHIFPTLRGNTAKHRKRERDSLALRYLADDFARTQIELRLAALLGHLMNAWNPRLVIVDNSPFHVGLGDAVRTLFETEPRRLAHAVSGEVQKALKEACWLQLEVLGTEPSEIATLDAVAEQLGMGGPRGGDPRLPKGRARAWVINRDQHLSLQTPSAAGSMEKCSVEELAKGRGTTFAQAVFEPGAPVAHVLYNRDLGAGLLGREQGGRAEKALKAEAGGSAAWDAAWEGVTKAIQGLRPWVLPKPSGGGVAQYQEKEWLKWAAELTGPRCGRQGEEA